MRILILYETVVFLSSLFRITIAMSCDFSNIAHISGHVIKLELLSHKKEDTDRRKSLDILSILTQSLLKGRILQEQQEEVQYGTSKREF